MAVASYRLRCQNVQAVLRARGVMTSIVSRTTYGDRDCSVAVFVKAYGEAERAHARRLVSKGVKVILDLCDNHFVYSHAHPHLLARRDLLLRMIANVDLVTCSTPSLASLVPQKPTAVVDDTLEAVDDPWWALGCLRRKSRGIRFQSPAQELRLIWFGSAGENFPAYGLCDVNKVGACLARIHAASRLSLTVVSNSFVRFREVVRPQPFPIRYVAWRRWRLPFLLRTHHVCILPVTANDFTICKTANRAATALRCDIPVVAEPIPSYQELGEFLELGEIHAGVRTVADNYQNAVAKAARGHAFVDNRFSASVVGSQWISAFRKAIGEAP